MPTRSDSKKAESATKKMSKHKKLPFRERVRSQSQASRTDWKRLAEMTDDEIRDGIARDPDAAPELDHVWFATAKVIPPGPKEAISIRLDPEVLDFFRKEGPGYQSRIGQLLLGYVRHQAARAQQPRLNEVGRRRPSKNAIKQPKPFEARGRA